MSQNQFIRRLKREATRNPKKLGALGVLLVVAVWFWAPMVRGWFHKDEPVPAPQASPSAATGVPGVGIPNPVGGNEPGNPPAATYSWDQVVEWMEEDPLTKAAETLPARRDPFRVPQDLVVVEAARARHREQRETSAITPAGLGLKLTGTIIGPQQSVALINGRTYRQGTQIACEKGGSRYNLRLVEVRRKGVVLECRGTRLQLAISE